MSRSLVLTDIEHLMLQEIAKKNRSKPLNCIKKWIQTEYAKINK